MIQDGVKDEDVDGNENQEKNADDDNGDDNDDVDVDIDVDDDDDDDDDESEALQEEDEGVCGARQSAMNARLVGLEGALVCRPLFSLRQLPPVTIASLPHTLFLK